MNKIFRDTNKKWVKTCYWFDELSTPTLLHFHLLKGVREEEPFTSRNRRRRACAAEPACDNGQCNLNETSGKSENNFKVVLLS